MKSELHILRKSEFPGHFANRNGTPEETFECPGQTCSLFDNGRLNHS